MESKDDFRCPVKAGDQVGCDFVVSHEHSTAKVAHLDHIVAPVDQDVVRLDVSMQHAALLHEMEGHQHLSCHGTHRIQSQSNPLPILFGQLP